MSDYRKMAAYLTALADAQDAVEAGKKIEEPVEEAPVKDVAAEKVSASNIAIAGSGVKAELCGTISDEPTATVEALVRVGFDEKLAAEMIDKGAAVRADALDLRKPVDIKPSPVEEVIK